jgi:hypothetical protein
VLILAGAAVTIVLGVALVVFVGWLALELLATVLSALRDAFARV